MNLDALFQNEAFSFMNKEQAEAYKNLYNKLQGKNQLECMGIIMEFQRTMPKGRKMTPQENKAMIMCIMDAMDDREKEKFVNIIKMLDN